MRPERCSAGPVCCSRVGPKCQRRSCALPYPACDPGFYAQADEDVITNEVTITESEQASDAGAEEAAPRCGCLVTLGHGPVLMLQQRSG
jgi:hypothetical protein